MFHTDSNSIGGLEALIRWQHPIEGRIPPDVFIPYAESNGLIVPLTRQLFRLIAEDAPQLAALPRGGKVGLNISPAHLSAPSFHRTCMNCWRSCRAITSRWCLKSPSAAWWKKSALAEFDWLHKQGIGSR